MAGRGPAPKDPSNKVRRNKEERVVIEAADAPADRELPNCPFEFGWLDEVDEWWSNWCGSPMASQFLETDWFRLGALAVLVQKWIASQDMEAFKEWRIQEAQFGATIADRLRLKWDVAKTVPDSATKPRADVGRRLKVVGAEAS